MSAVLKFDIQDNFEVFQSMAHKQLDESLEKLRPLFEQDKSPTLLEISSALQEAKQELSGALLQEAAHSLNQQQRDQEFFPCPHCGCSSANTLLIFGLQIKHTERKIGSTDAHEWARIKKIIFRPADRRPESFIQLLRDKSFVVCLPCRKAMAFACQPPCPVKLTELPA